MRKSLAALLLASYLTGAPEWAVCANAQAASLFQETEIRRPPQQPHKAAWVVALAGTGLIAASYPLAARADERYADYLAETDVALIEDRYLASRTADRWASASLLSGEALLVTAVYLRFIRRASPARLAMDLTPHRCAVSLRF